MRRFLILLALAGVSVAVVVGAGAFVFWDVYWRWQPKTVTKDHAEIIQALDQSGWVSPHLTGPHLYVIVYRDCAACVAFEQAEFPRLQAAGVDTRVIVVARPDSSTPAERTTVAELWTNRSWKLFQQWSLAPPQGWTAQGLPPADGDAARTAVIGVGRSLVGDLTSQLKDNGVRFAYPMLIWPVRGKADQLRACACEDPRSYRDIAKEFGPT
ncbi:MAG TPA: hypothetical protein VGG29_01215 [Caulobacteraceae bacterium]|jgi:hypothetical protein